MSGMAATPYAFTSTGVVGPQNAASSVCIHGITARETAGTNSITITIRDSGASSGKIVAEFSIAAGTGLGNGILPKIKVPVGCYAAVGGSGTASAVLYIS